MNLVPPALTSIEYGAIKDDDDDGGEDEKGRRQ